MKGQYGKISVLITFHNEEDLINSTLGRVLTFDEVGEVIAIDCQSDDETRTRLFEFSDRDDRVHVHRVETSDVFEAFNIGLTRATKPYIQFLRAGEYVEALSEAISLLNVSSVDMVVSNAKQRGLMTNVAYHPELLENIQLSHIIYKKTLIDTFKLSFYSGKEGIYLFNTMALMASNGIALIPEAITYSQYSTCWYNDLSFEEWERFLVTNSWLLQAAQPIPEIYRTVVTFLLEHLITYGFSSSLTNIEKIKRANCLKQWLEKEKINYKEYALASHLYLKYQALCSNHLLRFIAFLTENGEEIIYSDGSYQPRIPWHRPLMPEQIYLTGTLELQSQTTTSWSGKVVLENDLPLINPKISAHMIHTISGEKIPISASMDRDDLFIEVDTQKLCRYGEWQLEIQLISQNAQIVLNPKGNERLLFFRDAQGRFIGRYSHQLSLYIQQPLKEESQFLRFECTADELILSIQLSDNEHLAFYHKESHQWILGHPTITGSYNAYGLSRQQLLPGNYEVYRCNGEGIYPLGKEVSEIDERIEDGIYEYHLKSSSHTTLSISVCETQGEVRELDSILEISLFENQYETLGYTLVSLLLAGDIVYRIPFIDRKAKVETCNIEQGEYCCYALYQNGKQIIKTPINIEKESVSIQTNPIVNNHPLTFVIQREKTAIKMKQGSFFDYNIHRYYPVIENQVLIHTKHQSLLQPLANHLESLGFTVHWSNDLTGHEQAVAFARSAYIMSDMLFSNRFGKRSGQVLIHIPTEPLMMELNRWNCCFKTMKQKEQKQWLHHIQQFDCWYIDDESEELLLREQFQFQGQTPVITTPLRVALSQRPQLESGTLSVGLLVEQPIDFRQLLPLKGKVTFYVLEDTVTNVDNEWVVSIPSIDVMAKKVSVIVSDQEVYLETFKKARRSIMQYENEYELLQCLSDERDTTAKPYDVEKTTNTLAVNIKSLSCHSTCTESLVLKPFIQTIVHKGYEYLFNMVGCFPATNTIVFESFYGKKYADNPKALYLYAKEHYPEYRLIWTVQKGYEHNFEEEGIPYVVANSVKALWIQARAKYWIQNTRMVLWKHPGRHTTVLQTWHGTPWKRLGLDIEQVSMPGVTKEEYHTSFLADTKKWDFLIAPNAYSLNIFRSAFAFETTKMLPTGYPRNDRLVNATKKDYDYYKAKLNIPRHKKVVLYAPTWRDDENKGQGAYQMKLMFDIQAFKEKFGEEAVLLVRSHYFITDLELSENEDVIDVSNYQDISDLYLASDVLVTDYSSAFFDYALLKRPMIFFAYDKEDYCHETRGFYFDYDTVPGPIVTNNKDLMESLEEALHHPKVSDNYPTFYERYLSWEDGKASQHTFEMLFGQKEWSVVEVDNHLKHAVVNGTPKLRNIQHSTVLVDENGHDIEIERTYQTVDPIHGMPEGPEIYQVHLHQQVGYLFEDDILYEDIK